MSILRKDKDKSKDYKQESEEEKIVSSFTALYRNYYANKSSVHVQWDKNFKAYDASLFKQNLPDYKTQEISNFVFSTVETVKPIMLSGNPKFQVLPNKEMDFAKSKTVQYALDYEWSRTKMFTLLNTALTVGLVYGTVIMGCFWDGDASNGLGQVKPIIISPFNIFVDPMATCIDDAQRVYYATYKSVGELMKAYPERAEELKLQAGDVKDEYLTYGKDFGTGSANQILYLECYSRDYSYDETIEEELDEDGNKTGNKYQVKKRKYPNGRRTIIAGDLLLSDANSPYDDGKFPFVAWKCYDVPSRFWGIGEVEMIISPQETICEIYNTIIESAQLTSNPIWILDKNCGVERNSLTNRKGLIVRKNPGTEVKREQPPALPSYLENIILTMKQDIEQISGVYDVTRGEKPSGITAAAAIEALNEQAQGRIKLKIQCMEQCLGEFGSMWISRVQQFWVTKRTIRIMGQQYTPNSDVDSMLQQQSQQNAQQMAGQYPDPTMPQQGQGIRMPDGKTMTFSNIDGDDVDGDFDIIVVAGSTMAVNKTARLQQVISMAQTTAEDGMPLVDRQTVLENADLPNAQDILQRFEQMKQNQAKNAPPPSVPSSSVPYELLPPEGKMQLAQQIGVKIDPQMIINQSKNELMDQIQLQEAKHESDMNKIHMQHSQNQEINQTDMINQAAMQDASHEQGLEQQAIQHKQGLEQQMLQHKQGLESSNNDAQNQGALQSETQNVESDTDTGISQTADPNTNQGGETEELYILLQQIIGFMVQNDPQHFALLAQNIPALGEIVQSMQNNQPK